MLLSAIDAKRLADRLLSRSKADHCVITMGGGDGANLRFARGSATTNGYRSSLRVKVDSRFGKRSGAVSMTGLDDNALDEAVSRSELMARSAPENPELLPPPGPQSYPSGAGYDAATAEVRADRLAAETKPVIDEAARRNIDVTGYSAAGHRFEAIATSAGLFAHDRHTGAEFTVSARNREGTWSGWAGVSETQFGRLDAARLGRRAIDKAAYAAPPVRLEPGKYTVILEPSPVSDLVGSMRVVHECAAGRRGRSFFSAKGGGNKIGEKLFPDDVTIFSDPTIALLRSAYSATTVCRSGAPSGSRMACCGTWSIRDSGRSKRDASRSRARAAS